MDNNLAQSEKSTYIYFVVAPEINRVKIGKSNDPKKRFGQLRAGSSVMIELFGFIEAPAWFERYLHGRLKHKHIIREWFRFDDSIKNLIYQLTKYGYKKRDECCRLAGIDYEHPPETSKVNTVNYEKFGYDHAMRGVKGLGRMAARRKLSQRKAQGRKANPARTPSK